MSSIADTISALRRVAGVLESLDREAPLLEVAPPMVTVFIPKQAGTEAERIREVLRINEALGIDPVYEVSRGDSFRPRRTGPDHRYAHTVLDSLTLERAADVIARCVA